MGADLDRYRNQLDQEYARFVNEASEAKTLYPRDNIPIRLSDHGRIQFLPATSLAVQSLILSTGLLHKNLVRTIQIFKKLFPPIINITFWQPSGTFHLNIVILNRLKPGKRVDYKPILAQADHALGWLARQPVYTLFFRGVVLTKDGTIFAKGYPTEQTPWNIRRYFSIAGFPSQQPMFHITLGRLLKPLPDRVWQEVRDGINHEFHSIVLGKHTVRKALLIDEHEGFLHSCDSYRCLRKMYFATARTPVGKSRI